MMPHHGFPIPKFGIGNRVYAATTDLRAQPQVCPDCLGTFRWSITTPAGESFQVNCGTCTYERVIPQVQYVPTTRLLTVGSVRVDTADRDGRPVSYMMKETGVGSGSIWYEENLFASEEEATARAQVLAAKQNDYMREDAERRIASAKKRPRRRPKVAS